MSKKYVVLPGIEGEFRKGLYLSLLTPKLRMRTDRYIGMVNNVSMAVVRDARRRLVAGGAIPDEPLRIFQRKHSVKELVRGRTKAGQRASRNTPALPAQTAAALMPSCSMNSAREDMSVYEQQRASTQKGTDSGRDTPATGTTR